MQSKTITYQSSTIFYRVTGKGSPVVLLHGFGEDGTIWDNQVNFLKEHFLLIIPDLPGSGQSEMITDMSVEGICEVIKEITTIELQKSPLHVAEGFTMIGHSMGGYITLAFAEKYPQLLSSFGLLHSTAFADSEEKKQARLKSIEFIKTHGAYTFLQTSIPGLFYTGAEGLQPPNPNISSLIEKGRQFSATALASYYEAMIARPDRTTVLKNFERPVLFIIGANDTAVPFLQSLQQCYLPKQSHIHILRSSAHMGMLEAIDETNNFLLHFLQ